MKKNKVLLLGWDAADWKTINPLMDQGLMPNMKRLVENGTISNLASLQPMYSPMLWSSIATGKRAYKHGVHGFTEVTPDGKSVRPVMSVSRKTKAIWNMMSQEGLKTHVVGWWPSHPAEKINGVMISDFFQKTTGKLTEAWPLSPGTIHPQSEAEFFAQFRVHKREISHNHLLPFLPKLAEIPKTDPRPYAAAKITAETASLHAAFTNIIRTRDWDFAALYLDGIDHYCHAFMKYHPPYRPHISVEDFEWYKDVVVAAYQYHDLMLGRIFELIDDQTTLILISDHGFQPDHLRPKEIPREPAGPAFEHSPFGIFAAMGPGIKKDALVYGTNLLDIAPTILTIMGLPVGEDMDGRVLEHIFDKKTTISYIPSWDEVEGDSGMLEGSSKETDLGDEAGKLALKQLEDLGYIESVDAENMEENVKKTRCETSFNLAVAYIDGGEVEDAIQILESLHVEFPEMGRFAFRLAMCYQAMGRIEEALELILDLRAQETYPESVLDMVEGNLLLSKKMPQKAIALFKNAEKNIDRHYARLNVQLAAAYQMLGRWDDAERVLINEIEYDANSDVAYFNLGKVYLNKKDFEKAESCFLDALSLEFNNPQYHLYFGLCLSKTGKYEAAETAYQNALLIQPDQVNALEKLIGLYDTHLNQKDKAADLRKRWEKLVDKTIYVVSGLPRSGTSMMMQMLDKGGMEVFTDKKREKDENNPKGYYEHEAVKSLARNNKWVPQAEGKVVKVIAQLLPHLPATFKYKIVFMDRNPDEVLASQRKMLNRLGKNTRDDSYPLQLMETYKKQLQTVKEWASKSPNVEILYVAHQNAIENPLLTALTVRSFLDETLLPELMASAVDATLYREKSSVSII